jgi:Mg-chelatase subunit ChlD
MERADTEQQMVSQAASALAQAGILTSAVASVLSQQDRLISIAKVQSHLEASCDPVFWAVLMDASGSMAPYRHGLIEFQRGMIDELRSSQKCRHDALYIGQWLFSTMSTVLNAFTPLHRSGIDRVVLLDEHSYRPDGATALYSTVFHVLQEVAGVIAYCINEGIRARFTLLVLTDGRDGASGLRPEVVKAIMQELRAKHLLRNSVIFGIANNDTKRDEFERMKDELGFDRAAVIEGRDLTARRGRDFFRQ